MVKRIRNRLGILMAEHGVRSVAALSRDTGIHYGTLLNFYHQKFDVFNEKVITALCVYFKCGIEDLLELIDEEAS